MSTPDFAENTTKRLQALLMPGETVRYAAQRHWLSYRRAFVWGSLCLIALTLAQLMRQPDAPFFMLFSDAQGGADRRLLELACLFSLLMGTFSALTTAIVNWTLIMAVTSRRIILRVGLVARDTTDLPLSKIDIVMIDQGVLDRILGCGTVIVRTVSEATTHFMAISHPTAFRNAIIAAIEDAGNKSSGRGD